MKEIRRGDLYMADLRPSEGSEQGSIRPVLIVSNNAGNRSSTISTVIPITSQEKKNIPVHVSLNEVSGLPKNSTALCEQLRTVDHTRMVSYLGHLEPAVMDEINRAISRNLDLDLYYKDKMYLCPKCRDIFFNSPAFSLRRLDKHEDNPKLCSFCGSQKGFSYYIFKRPIGQRKERHEYEV